MRIIILFLFLISSCIVKAPLIGQTSYYVSQEQGSNSNDGLSPETPLKTVEWAIGELLPGDTLLLMHTFKNASYNPDYSFSGDISDPHVWHSENTLRISNLHGSPNQYITIKSFDDNTLLLGDGNNVLRMVNCSYISVEDLHIKGEVDRIPLSTALALQFVYMDGNEYKYRVAPGTPADEVRKLSLPILGTNIPRPSYTDTKGIYLSNVHHIDLIDNVVHHLPGNGLRVSNCDYINIIGNEVHNCSRKSYSGTHGLVVTNAESMDNNTGYKIVIANNVVHHNYNEIYSWSPQKAFVEPRIDEGKGISMQRNLFNTGWTHGRFLITNNLAYWNGYSGVHSNDGTRMDYINNTCYMNSYTGTVTYANDLENQSGNQVGVSAQSNIDVNIYNNISVYDPSFGGFGISIANTTNFKVANNLTYGIDGTNRDDNDVLAVEQNAIKADPLFMDADNLDFRLTYTSPAINKGLVQFAPDTDYYGNPRLGLPDLGAIEFQLTSSQAEESMLDYKVFPNPFVSSILITSQDLIREVQIYNTQGIEWTSSISVIDQGRYAWTIDTQCLPTGSYIISVNGGHQTLIKL